MKVSVIGAGNIARAHLEAIDKIESLELQSIYDVDKQNAKEINKTYSGKVLDTFDEVIDNSDAVIIASPNYLHADQSIQVMKKKKHILCEKPMCCSLIEAQEMLVQARNNSVKASLGFNYRYLPIIRALKKLINEGPLEDVIKVSLEFKKSSALTRKTYTWRDNAKSNLTSGAMGDLGSHLLDALQYLFKSGFDFSTLIGNFKTNVDQKQNTKVHVDDHSYVCGRLNNGIYFDVLTSKSVLPQEAGFTIHIVGRGAEFYYTLEDPKLYYLKKSCFWSESSLVENQILKDPPTEVYGWADSFVYQLRDLAKVLPNGSTFQDVDIANFTDGYSIQKVIEHVLSKSD